MFKIPKHTHQITFLVGLFIAGLLLVGSSKMALAVLGPNDYRTNYEYNPPCKTASKGPDWPVVLSRTNNTPYACIRVTGDGKGYTVSSLDGGIIKNLDACPAVPGANPPQVFTVDAGGFGFLCVTVTDASLWDTSGYFQLQAAPADSTADFSCTDQNTNNCVLFQKYIIPLINFLSIGVGVIIIIMVIIGGLQYTTAGGDANKVAEARKKIFNAALSFLAFIFLYAFLQWIVPGGIL